RQKLVLKFPKRNKLFNLRRETRSASLGFSRTAIAVGTLIAERPPHRTGRAQFRHPAPTLDVGGEAYGLPHALQAVGRALPARCPGRAVLLRVLLGPRPWLHELLGRSPGLVRSLHSDSWRSLTPRPRASSASARRLPDADRSPHARPGSRSPGFRSRSL